MKKISFAAAVVVLVLTLSAFSKPAHVAFQTRGVPFFETIPSEDGVRFTIDSTLQGLPPTSQCKAEGIARVDLPSLTMSYTILLDPNTDPNTTGLCTGVNVTRVAFFMKTPAGGVDFTSTPTYDITTGDPLDRGRVITTTELLDLINQQWVVIVYNNNVPIIGGVVYLNQNHSNPAYLPALFYVRP